MKIGVISDTHGKIPPATFDLLKECLLILHAGDIGNFTIINDLKEIVNTNVIAVKGNCDNFSMSEYPQIQEFLSQLALGRPGRGNRVSHQRLW